MRAFLRSLIIIGSVAVVAVPLASARADTQPTTPQPAPAPAPVPQANQSPASDADGIVQLMDEAMSGITLRADQKDVLQKLGADVDAKVAAVDQARRDLLQTLSNQIEAGKVDADALHNDKEKVVDAAVAASPALRGAFEKLHDTLDPDQRKQFVAAFRDALQKRASMVDPQAQVDEWSKILNLTGDQKTKISAILGEDTTADDVAKARIDLVLAAFPGDTFSLDDLVPAGAVKYDTQQMVNRIIDVTSKVTNVLTPEQRQTAAKAIRDQLSEQPAMSEPSTGPASPSAPAATGPAIPSTPTPTATGPAIPSAPAVTGSTSQALCVGGGSGYFVGSRQHSTAYYGFRRSYGWGYGGEYLI